MRYQIELPCHRRYHQYQQVAYVDRRDNWIIM